MGCHGLHSPSLHKWIPINRGGEQGRMAELSAGTVTNERPMDRQQGRGE